jgi:Flp pilus assembly protein TadG
MARQVSHVLPAGLARLLRDEAGAVQFESALCYTIIFSMMLGILQFCMMVYTYGVYAEAARVGVRYAVSHGSNNTSSCSGPTTGCADSTGANVVAAAKNYAAGYAATISGMQVTASYPDSSSVAPSRVIVTISYSYAPFIRLTGFRQSFVIKAQGRIAY